jgi:hypothetical protein
LSDDGPGLRVSTLAFSQQQEQEEILYNTYNDQQSFRQFFGYDSTNHDSSGSS